MKLSPAEVSFARPVLSSTWLGRAIEQDSLTLVQCGSNRFQSQLESWKVLKNSGAILAVHHGSQKIALAYQQFVVLNQDLECGCLLTIALSHAVVSGNSLLLNRGLERANTLGQPLQALGCCHCGWVGEGLSPGGSWQELAPIFALGQPHAGHRDTKQRCGFAANQLIVCA